MEKIKFQSEDGIIEFFVEEQTTVAGITYLLVSDSQDDEANAYIMKDVSEEREIMRMHDFCASRSGLLGRS